MAIWGVDGFYGWWGDIKMSNSWTMEEVCKKEFDIMRLRHNEVNFKGTFDDY